MAKADKVLYIDAELYFYRINTNSIMHSRFNYKTFDEIEAADEIVQYVEKYIPTIKDAAYSRKFSSYSQVFRWTVGVENTAVNDGRKELWSYLVSYRDKMLLDPNARKK